MAQSYVAPGEKLGAISTFGIGGLAGIITVYATMLFDLLSENAEEQYYWDPALLGDLSEQQTMVSVALQVCGLRTLLILGRNDKLP